MNYQTRKLHVVSEVYRQVVFNGGFSVFWATKSQFRARVIDWMERHGKIVRKRGLGFGRFPWCGYKLGKNLKFKTHAK